jgi:hypothetical protein
VVQRLKTKSGITVENSKPILIQEEKPHAGLEAVYTIPIDSVSREERKKQAGKPLYLLRYE